MAFLRPALIVVFLFATMPVARAEGYAGLIPDSDTKSSAAAKGAAKPKGGYQGLLADPETSGKDNSAADALVSKRAPVQTTIPGSRGYEPAQDTNSLKTQALIKSYEFDPKTSIDPATRARMTVMRADAAKNYKPMRRIGGLLPFENTVKKLIDGIMTKVKDPKITDEERRNLGRDSYNQLLTMNDGLVSSSTISDEVYQSMGLPDTYIKEQREANRNSLKRVRDALAELKPYE